MINKYSSFVKKQIEHNTKCADRYQQKGDANRANSYRERQHIFQQLLLDLSSLQQFNQSNPPDESSLRLTQEDIQDLPEELLAELSISESDRKEFMLLSIIDNLGGIASLDQILIAIYRKTGEIEKRTRLVSRLYRMGQKGLVFSSPERKGVYSTADLSGADSDDSHQQAKQGDDYKGDEEDK